MKLKNCIGIFDSGVGGLSVYQALQEHMPQMSTLYVADSANLPYGDKSIEEIYILSKKITEWLIAKGCEIIIIACNTASAASLHELRKEFPNVNFIGMEPAVKPAAEQTQTGTLGVIATVATFQGILFKSVVERYAQNVTVIERPCPGLVQMIEAGKIEDAETEEVLRDWLQPMLDKGMDRLVLACTHYPFVTPLLKKICGDKVAIINPAPAIARQAEKVYAQIYSSPSEAAIHLFYTTGRPEQFKEFAETIGMKMDVVEKLVLEGGQRK